MKNKSFFGSKYHGKHSNYQVLALKKTLIRQHGATQAENLPYCGKKKQKHKKILHLHTNIDTNSF